MRNQGTESSILSSFIIFKSKEPCVAASDSARRLRVRGWGGGERPCVETERQTMDLISYSLTDTDLGEPLNCSETQSRIRNKLYPRPDQHPESWTNARSQKLVVRELGNMCLCGRYHWGLGGPAPWRSWNGASKRGCGHLVAGCHGATPSANVISRLNCDK